MNPMLHVLIVAAGTDRPGMVAAVTGVLVDQGCNLEDTSMSILHGQFVMMLVVAVPNDFSLEELEAKLEPVASDFGLMLSVRRIDDPSKLTEYGDEVTITVHGVDRPGIVHGVASLLAAHGVNIVDLNTRVIGEEDNPVYAMFLDVNVPPKVNNATLVAELDELAIQLGVSCSVSEADAEIL